MKGYSILILLALLLFSDFAFSQTCPCDTLELSDGTTGNEIIELICPGGELGEGTLFELSQFSVAVGTESAFYQALNLPDLGSGCLIGLAGVGTDGIELTPEETEICRQSLIQRCDLKLITPIPTLSEWGMIATAGVLGIIGLIVAARRRKAAA
ncbi:MAG TPA: IPTL-CTERM sorting domain-containing protein [Thermodesulfobacteriota bacterium]|nr:IPTL-CTERM sorting domain-containing protein [Thermodesulfobacteriota bacterium]